MTPRIGDPAELADELVTALEAADVAAVLARFAEADEDTLIERIATLRPLVQQRGVALLIDRRPDLVVQAGADGAHVTGLDALEAGLASLRTERMIGVGGLKSRHDAMLAAETGADYVMFGEPDPIGWRPGFDAIIERAQWWAELFEVPCVGFADSLDEVARLAAAKVEFVAVGDLVWNAGGGTGGAIRAVAEHLLVREPAP